MGWRGGWMEWRGWNGGEGWNGGDGMEGMEGRVRKPRLDVSWQGSPALLSHRPTADPTHPHLRSSNICSILSAIIFSVILINIVCTISKSDGLAPLFQIIALHDLNLKQGECPKSQTATGLQYKDLEQTYWLVRLNLLDFLHILKVFWNCTVWRGGGEVYMRVTEQGSRTG